MKKIFLTIMLITMLFITTGCGKKSEEEIKNTFTKEVDKLNSYYLEGVMTLMNNDDVYNYDVKVSYKKDNNYKVSLINKNNNYEQIILRNDEGVYVITPSLNKSFKFQSDWPNNNSQSYLLDSVANDLKNTKTYEFELKDNDYIYKIDANYKNNPNITSQNITLDKDGNLKKVEVQDKNGISHITFEITKLDKKPTFTNDYFNLDTVTKDFTNTENDKKDETNNETNTDTKTETSTDTTNETEQDQNVSSIDETLFPLYIPENTSLSNREVIEIENGERVIMTFAGDNPFMLVQETVTKEEELTIIPTYGEPYLLIDTVGSLTDMSYTWTSNGIEYYIVSDTLNQNEILEIAKSIGVVATINEK